MFDPEKVERLYQHSQGGMTVLGYGDGIGNHYVAESDYDSLLALYRDHTKNLAMLVRRLVVRLQHGGDGEVICNQAMEYLRKTGLANPTDILR